MKTISLTQGKVALVDLEDFDSLSRFKWFAHKEGKAWYAMRNLRVSESSKPSVRYMHAQILNTPPGMDSLHVNGDGLDNRRQNLKIGTVQDNRKSFVRPLRNNKTGFRGVGYHQRGIRAFISVDRKHFHLGYFPTLEAAAHARDAKARELGWPEEGMNFPRH